MAFRLFVLFFHLAPAGVIPFAKACPDPEYDYGDDEDDKKKYGPKDYRRTCYQGSGKGENSDGQTITLTMRNCTKTQWCKVTIGRVRFDADCVDSAQELGEGGKRDQECEEKELLDTGEIFTVCYCNEDFCNSEILIQKSVQTWERRDGGANSMWSRRRRRLWIVLALAAAARSGGRFLK